MSYNNIGLTTPRGSGTSGYVQRNLSHTRRTQDSGSQQNYREQPNIALRKPDQSILEHERKRQIENKCLELESELEDQLEPKLNQNEIEERVEALRQKLLHESHSDSNNTSKNHSKFSSKPRETHEIAAMKIEENEKFRKAFRVKGTYEEGQAFDKEYQAQRKAQAIENRSKREEQERSNIRPMQSKTHFNRNRDKPYQKPT